MAVRHHSFSFCVVFSVLRVAVELPSAATSRVKVLSPSDFVHVRVPRSVSMSLRHLGVYIQ